MKQKGKKRKKERVLRLEKKKNGRMLASIKRKLELVVLRKRKGKVKRRRGKRPEKIRKKTVPLE